MMAPSSPGWGARSMIMAVPTPTARALGGRHWAQRSSGLSQLLRSSGSWGGACLSCRARLASRSVDAREGLDALPPNPHPQPHHHPYAHTRTHFSPTYCACSGGGLPA